VSHRANVVAGVDLLGILHDDLVAPALPAMGQRASQPLIMPFHLAVRVAGRQAGEHGLQRFRAFYKNQLNVYSLPVGLRPPAGRGASQLASAARMEPARGMAADAWAAAADNAPAHFGRPLIREIGVQHRSLFNGTSTFYAHFSKPFPCAIFLSSIAR
jgi:hypothetical protein